MQQLRTTFDTFRTEVDTALEAVGNQLDAREYALAARTLNTLTERMAKTSLAVRTILIKGGHIEGDA
jgi:hypothetical protein